MKYSIFFMIIVFFSLHGMEVDTSEADCANEIDYAKVCFVSQGDISHKRLTERRWYSDRDRAPDKIRSVSYNPHRQDELTTGSEADEVRIWDTERERVKQSLSGHMVSYNPHCQGELATGSADGVVRLWDTGKGRIKQSLKAYRYFRTCIRNPICYNPHCQSELISASHDNRLGKIWDTRTDNSVQTFDDGQGVSSVDYDPHSDHHFASGSCFGMVEVWDKRHLNEAFLKSRSQEDISREGLKGSIFVCYDPHHKSELAYGESDGGVWRWNTEKTIHEILIIPNDRTKAVTSIDYNPHCKDELAYGLTGDGALRIFDIRTRTLKKFLSGHQGVYPCVDSVRYNPHKDELASGASDGTVRLWNLAPMRAIQKWFDEGCKPEKEREGEDEMSEYQAGGSFSSDTQSHWKRFEPLWLKIKLAHQHRRKPTLSKEDRTFLCSLPENIRKAADKEIEVCGLLERCWEERCWDRRWK